MRNFNEMNTYYKNLIDENLPKLMPEKGVAQQEVIKAMEYSLLDGGKRVRGIILLAVYQMLSQRNAVKSVPFAGAIEMIQSYSLIHDDLPCMDDDDLRRGKPSCHIKFGEATALLAGDALLTLAFETMSNEENLEFFTPKQIMKSVNILAKQVGTYGMIGGQVRDLLNETKVATLKEVEETELLKTGAFIAASAQVGGILGGATPEEMDILKDYGENLGLAFQIVDDILDTTSTEEKLGKPIGSDKEQNKSTFTKLVGLDGARTLAENHTNKALADLEMLKHDNKFLIELTKQMLIRDY